MRLERVDVDIAGIPVLRGIDWQLNPKTFWGVIGANGSGKSTFLALVAGLLWPAPARGLRRYDFGNGVKTDAIEARRRITLVGPELQNRYARASWNFAAEAVVLSGVFRTDIPRFRPSPADKIRAHALLRESRLAHLAERRFLELSRGEQRRVLIARALAFRPSVLLLDEPASGLDRDARRELETMLERIAATTTIVCSAHEARDLPSPAIDVLCLERGRITARSRPEAAPAEGGRSDIFCGSELRSRFLKSRAELAPTRGPLIEIEHADVWMRGRRVLHDVDWRLGNAEHWRISGANGAGKSTFLKLLHGQLRPARGGTIRWPALGNPRNVWQLRRRIGYVSAELHADYRYPSTVRQCVASGIDSSIGLARALAAPEEARVADLLERFALTPLANRALTTLSYGQMHCVLLARTLINAPRVLLLDEPWEGLDAETRALVRTQIAAAMTAGTQIVCASHVGDVDLKLTHEATIAGGRLSGRRLGLLSSDGGAAVLREN